MPSYLLRAPEGDMERWKLAADTKGVSMAAFFRTAADLYAQCIAFPEAAFHVASTPVHIPAPLEEIRPGKRSYSPDLRPARKGKK